MEDKNITTATKRISTTQNGIMPTPNNPSTMLNNEQHINKQQQQQPNQHQQQPQKSNLNNKNKNKNNIINNMGPAMASLLDQTGSLDDLKKLKKEQQVDHDGQSGFYFPRRYIMAILLFSICMLMNCQRSCLSVAIVAMSSDTKYWDGDQWIDQVRSFPRTGLESIGLCHWIVF